MLSLGARDVDQRQNKNKSIWGPEFKPQHIPENNFDNFVIYLDEYINYLVGNVSLELKGR